MNSKGSKYLFDLVNAGDYMKLLNMLVASVVFFSVTGLSLLEVAYILFCDPSNREMKHARHGPPADHAS